MNGARERDYAALRATAPRPSLPADLVEAFAARFRAQNGQCARLAAPADVPGWIEARFAPAAGDPLPLAIADDALLAALPWASSARLSRTAPAARPRASLGVTTAFAAVAETGALALHPRREAPMALNFLPDRLVVVVRATDVVGTFEDFWQCARARFGTALPRGLCLAAGPSSSADIEMTFATGVHGPVELHALIV